jgi:plasmid stabilization system protein ParE
MTADSRKPAPPELLIEARQTATLLAAATAQNARVIARLEGAVEAASNDPSIGPSTTDPRAEHRRNHRRGLPSKIIADSELEAFVRARMDRLTFQELADAVAEAFPPHRRAGRSSLHRWWHRHAKPQPLNRQ